MCGGCVLHVASLVDGDGYASDISDCQHLLSEISYVLSDDRITLIERTKMAPRVRSRWGVLCNETEKSRRPGLRKSYRALTSSGSCPGWPSTQTGSASCRDRVCQYVEMSGGAGSNKKKTGGQR